MRSDVTMRYLLRTNTSYKHLAKKLERAVITLGETAQKWQFVYEDFLFVSAFLASENDLYELAIGLPTVPVCSGQSWN